MSRSASAGLSDSGLNVALLSEADSVHREQCDPFSDSTDIGSGVTMSEFTDAELAAFLDEALPACQSSELEERLRNDADLRRRLTEIQGRQAAGLHTIGAIWRRDRLSCPSRSELGQYLLEALDAETADYIRFHLRDVGCRYCQANLTDLQEASTSTAPTDDRRKRYFQTSVGYLGKH